MRTPMLIWAVAVAGIALLARWHWIDEAIGAVGGRVLRIAGLATYPLYLLHDVVGAYILHAFAIHGINRWGALLAVILVLCLASVAVCRLIEPRIRNSVNAAMSRIVSLCVIRA
jgi:peptidoglycan/LPS O-acetylase OafA/YrhL